MKTLLIRCAAYVLLLVMTLAACRKTALPGPVPPPSDTTSFYRIKVRAGVMVGEILYDSIPAPLKISSWDASGVRYQKDTMLSPGVNQILLSKSHVRFQLEMNKWGVRKDTILVRPDVKEGLVYPLIGWRAAKQLKAEITYTYTAGIYRPVSKMEFAYTWKKLTEVKFYEIFLKGNTELFNQTRSERFTYQDLRVAKVEEIHLINLGGEPGERFYQYDALGRISRTSYVYPSQQYTYRNVYAHVGRLMIIDVYPEGRSNPLATQYQLKMVDGNRVQSKTITNNETYGTTFGYDLHISPYIHMNWPDVLFYRLSKNNVTTQHSFDDVESTEDTRFEYSFDEDGFVTQVIRKDRNLITNDFLIVSKKEYKY